MKSIIWVGSIEWLNARKNTMGQSAFEPKVKLRPWLSLDGLGQVTRVVLEIRNMLAIY